MDSFQCILRMLSCKIHILDFLYSWLLVTKGADDETREEIEIPEEESPEDVQALPESTVKPTSNTLRRRYKFA